MPAFFLVRFMRPVFSLAHPRRRLTTGVGFVKEVGFNPGVKER